MIVSLIVAMDETLGIGKNNQIPWHLSNDLKRFKCLTMGHHLIMGRKTCESIGQALPGRTTIVVTRNPEYQFDDGLVAHSLEEAIRLAKERSENETFVIGGGKIFEAAIKFADRIYLTMVHTRLDCDVFFPRYEADDWMTCVKVFQEADDVNQYSSTFKIIKRKTRKNLNLTNILNRI